MQTTEFRAQNLINPYFVPVEGKWKSDLGILAIKTEIALLDAAELLGKYPYTNGKPARINQNGTAFISKNGVSTANSNQISIEVLQEMDRTITSVLSASSEFQERKGYGRQKELANWAEQVIAREQKKARDEQLAQAVRDIERELKLSQQLREQNRGSALRPEPAVSNIVSRSIKSATSYPDKSVVSAKPAIEPPVTQPSSSNIQADQLLDEDVTIGEIISKTDGDKGEEAGAGITAEKVQGKGWERIKKWLGRGLAVAATGLIVFPASMTVMAKLDGPIMKMPATAAAQGGQKDFAPTEQTKITLTSDGNSSDNSAIASARRILAGVMIDGDDDLKKRTMQRIADNTGVFVQAIDLNNPLHQEAWSQISFEEPALTEELYQAALSEFRSKNPATPYKNQDWGAIPVYQNNYNGRSCPAGLSESEKTERDCRLAVYILTTSNEVKARLEQTRRVRTAVELTAQKISH